MSEALSQIPNQAGCEAGKYLEDISMSSLLVASFTCSH